MVQLNFQKQDGLIPVIAQDYETGEVLMQAYTNPEAWRLTLETGIVHYWSRSRNTLWKKGESSGNMQKVKEIRVDCDEDCILIKVEQIGGAACHLGYRSCFFRRVEKNELIVDGVQVFDPDKVYGG